MQKLYGIRCDDPADRREPGAWEWVSHGDQPLLFAEFSGASEGAKRAREAYGLKHARAAHYGNAKA